MRRISADYAGLGITEIARTVCELLEWKRPSGGLKNHECRLLLEQLRDQGRLALPPVRALGPRGPRKVELTGASQPGLELTGSAAGCEPLRLILVKAGESNSVLWREYVERHDYLGYRAPVGAQLRHLVRAGDRDGAPIVACLGWTSPAWKMAARDRWIGWSPAERERNLQCIVNNSRFLILPWVRVKGLASKILALCAQRLPGDWEAQYGYRPLLLETLVDSARFKGTCYRAANWVHVGATTGRGRMDRCHEADGSEKDIYVYPLCRNVGARLRAGLVASTHPTSRR
jgi:hypothetical protein